MTAKREATIRGLRAAALRLNGKRCSAIVGGPGTGAIMSLELGGRLLRRTPLKNKALPEERRRTDSEFALFVLCSWRLDMRTEVVCSSKDDNATKGPMMAGLRRLVGRRVERIDFDRVAGGLVLSFEGGYVFRIFCDSPEGDDNYGDYFLISPRLTTIVGPRGAVRSELRDDVLRQHQNQE